MLHEFTIEVGSVKLILRRINARKSIHVLKILASSVGALLTKLDTSSLQSALEENSPSNDIAAIAPVLQGLQDIPERDLNFIFDAIFSSGHVIMKGQRQDLTPETWPDLLIDLEHDLYFVLWQAIKNNFPRFFDPSDPRSLRALLADAQQRIPTASLFRTGASSTSQSGT